MHIANFTVRHEIGGITSQDHTHISASCMKSTKHRKITEKIFMLTIILQALVGRASLSYLCIIIP